jgi:radical SAM protein with 4Fe4S-binding SPASM domain
MPCNAMFYPVGNIKNESLSTIWNSRQLKAIQEIRFKELPNCQGCTDSSFCVRCAGIALSETSSMISRLDYACLVARLRHLYNVQN